MSEDRVASANYEQIITPTRWPLDVEIIGQGQVSGPGIACQPDCQESYPEGTLVTLRAEALPGWRFVGWEGECVPAEEECQVRMDEARSVRARFEEARKYTLLFLEDPRGRGTSTSQPTQSEQIDCGTECLAIYPDGATVTLRAEPLPGSRLVSWGDDCAGTPVGEDCTLVMSEDRVASASYEQIRWPLYVEIIGQGQVSGPGISCQPDCQESYPEGTLVTLRAEADSGWRFVGWEGECVPAGEECQTTMDEARSVRARFAETRVEDPRLRIIIDVFRKRVLRGDFFRARLTFKNINKAIALEARPCLRIPRGVRVIKGGEVREGRICWKRGDLLPGKPRRFNLLFRAQTLGKKKFTARGTASNSPPTEDRDRIRVLPRPAPHPPTG